MGEVLTNNALKISFKEGRAGNRSGIGM